MRIVGTSSLGWKDFQGLTCLFSVQPMPPHFLSSVFWKHYLHLLTQLTLSFPRVLCHHYLSLYFMYFIQMSLYLVKRLSSQASKSPLLFAHSSFPLFFPILHGPKGDLLSLITCTSALHCLGSFPGHILGLGQSEKWLCHWIWTQSILI